LVSKQKSCFYTKSDFNYFFHGIGILRNQVMNVPVASVKRASTDKTQLEDF